MCDPNFKVTHYPQRGFTKPGRLDSLYSATSQNSFPRFQGFSVQRLSISQRFDIQLLHLHQRIHDAL